MSSDAVPKGSLQRVWYPMIPLAVGSPPRLCKNHIILTFVGGSLLHDGQEHGDPAGETPGRKPEKPEVE